MRSVILAPVWTGTVAFEESVMVVENADGSVNPISLLHPAIEILEVKSLYSGIIYKDGTDYALDENGNLLILSGSSIPVTAYQDIYLKESIPEKSFQKHDGGYLRFSEDGFFHKAQIAVTYRHAGEWHGNIPKRQGDKLSKTNAMMAAKKPLKVLFYGDSITAGGNASGFLKLPPYLPCFAELVVAEWKKQYGYEDIAMINTAVGGKNSFWAVEEAEKRMVAHSPDLMILGFGMNDGKTEPKVYRDNIRFLIEAVRSANKDCEIILIAPMLPNKELTRFWGNQRLFLRELTELASQYPGIAVADMTTMHSELLKRKAFLDMTGNNVNHTNDYLTRVYAQVILETFK